MVNKITTPPTTSELIGKVNELVDNKQDTLVSSTNIKTINNTSILGSGNIDIQGGGSSYTAGTGIDITNDVISVTNAISTGAALGATALQPSALNGYATETWVGQQGYITSSALNGYATENYVDTGLASKQAVLVSGTNIKTINNTSILGSGNIDIQGGSDVEAFTAAEVQTIWNGVS